MSLGIKIKLLISRLLQSRKNAKGLARIKRQLDTDLVFIDAISKDDTTLKGTLVVKCDDIGDFLVWQQVLPILAKHAEKPLYLVANKAIKPLYESYFDQADEVIWIDKSRWHEHEYRKSMFELVSKLKVNTAFTPLFTRNYAMDDLLVLASGAKEKLAWSSTHHYIYPGFDRLESRFERTIVSDVPNKLEYFRNIEFVNKVYHLSLPETFVPLFPNFKKYPTLVIVPVASAPSKTWPAENFARLITAVKSQFSRILIIGGANSVEASELIIRQVNDSKLVNLVNQTSLNELFAFIGEASLLLTVDTFAAHMGPLCATNTVVIANGTNWQRFGNYEPFIQLGFKLVLPPHVKKDLNKIKKYYNGDEIAQIDVNSVVRAINELQSGS